ncbi:MAG: diguanylate cyclase [Methanobrevibacter sp.]|nr:diguanylate cyclase [Methanobrevibacter sp.]
MAMGISLYNSSYDESVENVFKRADKAMYENKRMMKSENR